MPLTLNSKMYHQHGLQNCLPAPLTSLHSHPLLWLAFHTAPWNGHVCRLWLVWGGKVSGAPGKDTPWWPRSTWLWVVPWAPELPPAGDWPALGIAKWPRTVSSRHLFTLCFFKSILFQKGFRWVYKDTSNTVTQTQLELKGGRRKRERQACLKEAIW